jgi:hypothetical protein
MRQEKKMVPEIFVHVLIFIKNFDEVQSFLKEVKVLERVRIVPFAPLLPSLLCPSPPPLASTLPISESNLLSKVV